MFKIKNSWLFFVLMYSVAFAQSSNNNFGKPVEITVSGSRFIQPVWSPNNQKIAMAGANYKGIWVMESDGQNLVQVSKDISAGYRFSWSNNSEEILVRAIEYVKKRRKYFIKLHNITTGEREVVAEFKKGHLGVPKWSSDNTRIFVSSRGKVKLLEVNGRVSKNAAKPAVQDFHNNKTNFLIFDSEFRMVSTKRPVAGSYLNASQSPNGNNIAFEVLGGNMFVCNIDGSNVIDLGQGERPGWAPGSDWLTYVITKDDGHQILNSDIYIIKADGTGKQNITNSADRIEMNPNWSPDGNTIVFDDRKSGQVIKILKL